MDAHRRIRRLRWSVAALILLLTTCATPRMQPSRGGPARASGSAEERSR
jgi:hypothetical protein